ncbi:valine--tRNA ligase, partial [Patescibacteria group bacterium]
MFKEMQNKYKHLEIEPKIYEMWEKLGVFSPEKAQSLQKEYGIKTKDETFSVLMPPPNANAPLHCGHATYAIQDIMTRIRRMQGYSSIYFPGTDHAGFETQVVYEKKLKKEGKSRFDFDSKTLFKQILAFVKENSNVAINQLKRLGMSADWSRNTFMLDQKVLDRVFETFEKMHNDELVYRDLYLVNYSPHHGTTFSNLETVHVERVSPLYYVRYSIKGSNDFITVATVRPETLYADVAIAVNPDDQRYKNTVGKSVINPLNNQEIPIIEDSYVDVEFGTGALKITPGHDFNDYEIGKKHKLPMLSVIDLEGKMTSDAKDVNGMRIGTARKTVVEILQEKNAIEKIDEKYTNNILVDYKDNKPIEPMLLPNWFIKMKDLVEPAIEAVEEGDVEFYGPSWKKEMLRWLNNIHDWPVSRQIVFGIRIPIWYDTNANPDIFVVFVDEKGTLHEGKIGDLLEKGFTLTEIKHGLQKLISPIKASYKLSKESPGDQYLQETDTFDTWFSSGQWPLTTLNYPDGEEYSKFFPTSFMDTMWDILFFWIARMIIFSLYLTGKVPFKTVYIHGRISDEKGQKMSKSKGNVIDPIEYVEKYGSDALRMGVIVGGNTLAKSSSLSEDKVRGYRNFSNKIWNMTRFMLMMMDIEGCTNYEDLPSYSPSLEKEMNEQDKEIIQKLHQLVKDVNSNLEKYRFMDAGDAIYHFMWHELADIYIEQVKEREDKIVALSVLRHAMIVSLKLLHPFMPFITEEIWSHIPRKT